MVKIHMTSIRNATIKAIFFLFTLFCTQTKPNGLTGPIAKIQLSIISNQKRRANRRDVVMTLAPQHYGLRGCWLSGWRVFSFHGIRLPARPTIHTGWTNAICFTYIRIMFYPLLDCFWPLSQKVLTKVEWIKCGFCLIWLTRLKV